MKNETLLNKLLKIESKGIIDNDFTQLIEEIKLEIFNEENNFTTTKKQASKKALSFLNKLRKSHKPILGYCDYQLIDNCKCQVFTDSIIAFALKEYYELPTYEENKQGHTGYANLTCIFQNEKDGSLVENDVNTYLKKLKSKMYNEENGKATDSFISENITVYFDVNNLKKVVDILGTSKLKVYVFGTLKPILLIDEKTGNKAVICPVRKNK